MSCGSDDDEEIDDITGWFPSRVIEISSEDALFAFRDMNRDYAGYVVRLTRDIALTREWYPINEFAGTFEGGGHTISNLSVTGKQSTRGLFRTNEGTIRDLHVSGNLTGETTVGGICGNNSAGGRIENCSFSGTVTGSTYVGGICGMNQGEVIRCVNRSAVRGFSFVGGICGYAYNSSGKECRISNCINYGAVDGLASVGGICGYNGNYILVTDSYNEGRITGENGQIGGVVGYNVSEVVNCYNKAAVNSANGTEIGGICGNNQGSITACYNTGLVYGKYSYVGSICGSNHAATTVTACYYKSGTFKGGINGWDIPGMAEKFASLNYASASEVAAMNAAVDRSITQYRYQHVAGSFPVLVK